MNTQPPANPWQPTPEPVADSAPAAKARRRPGRAVAFIAAGAIGATAITGIAFAANNTPSPSPSQGNGPANPDDRGPGMMDDRDGDRGGMGPMGGPGRGHRGGPMGMGLGGPLLHGEGVVSKPDGTTVTMRAQTGEITAASSTEITVTSTDGFEQTWPLTADTKVHRDRDDATAGDLKVGDTAMVIGEVTDGKVTTLRVGALSPEEAAKAEQRREERQQERADRRGGPDGPEGPGGEQGSSPAPSPSA